MKTHHRAALGGCTGSTIGLWVGGSIGGFVAFSAATKTQPAQPIELVTGLIYLVFKYVVPIIASLIGVGIGAAVGAALGGAIGGYLVARRPRGAESAKPPGPHPEV
jgi:hypothetical protein